MKVSIYTYNPSHPVVKEALEASGLPDRHIVDMDQQEIYDAVDILLYNYDCSVMLRKTKTPDVDILFMIDVPNHGFQQR